MKRTNQPDVYATIPHVRSLSIRQAVGMGDQVELQIGLKRGDVTIRLLAVHGSAIRITNLRPRDKRRATPKVTVPFLNGDEP